MDSTYSLQGSFHGHNIRDSPRPVQRRLDRLPRYLHEASRSTLEHSETELKKPLAKVKPRQLLRSIASSDEYARFRNPENSLRQSKSLDPFPSQVRKRVDVKFLEKLAKKGSRSLDGGVALISRNPGIRISENLNSANPYKHINNNCNGSIGIEDPLVPLLLRQGSLTSPPDEILQYAKRWRSLETLANDDETSSKKTIGRGSIKSWLVGLFQGNGFRASDASLRKVGVMQSGMRGVTGFGELPPPSEKESIV